MNLIKPPKVGCLYTVPCVLGTPRFFSVFAQGDHSVRWWPIFVPSHEDSRYTQRERNVWKQIDESRHVLQKEIYFESDPNSPHHFHLDSRFIDPAWVCFDRRTPHYVLERANYAGVIFPNDYSVSQHELVCLHQLKTIIDPKSILGDQFVEDHRGKIAKCMRCPHKGIDLRSIPAINGVITCPAHGLQFKSKTLKCTL